MSSTSSTGWSYDVSLLSTSTATAATMIVRRLVGDVLIGDQQVTDGEINFAISEYSNYYSAGAEVARWIASQYSRKVDTVQGDLRTMYSAQADRYAKRAVELETRGKITGAGAMPYVGGISVSDKGAVLSDSDRVTPQFSIGMNENLLPVGVGSGNVTPGNPAGGNGENGDGGGNQP